MKKPKKKTGNYAVSPKTPDANGPAKKSFPIVGIGASAGGLEALETFIDHLPASPGVAIVIIQHLSPKHKSIMGQILQRHTSLPVTEVADGLEVAPNCVYFNAPDREVAIFNGKLHLMEPRTDQVVRLPIDYFFRSLAEDMGERAICIVLSGTGSDGTLGLQAVKGAGGLTMAQEESQAKYPFMPRSAILTGLVDHVLPVEEMPAELGRYLQHPYLKTPSRTVSTTKQFETFVDKILLLIRTTTRHDFTGYKQTTIRRRMERRMALHKLTRIADYYRYLQENSEEVQALFQDLLITVTNFFRDPEAFKILSDKVIPEIMARKGDRRRHPGLGAGLRHGGRGRLPGHPPGRGPGAPGQGGDHPGLCHRHRPRGHRPGPPDRVPGKHRRGCLPGAPQALFHQKGRCL